MVGPENAFPHDALAAKKLPFAMVVTKLIELLNENNIWILITVLITKAKKVRKKRIFFLGVTVNWFVRVRRRQAIAAVL